MNRPLNLIKIYLYSLALKFAISSKRNKKVSNTILLVRLDEIGDFILWRKFIADIACSDKFKSKRFHFVGNKAWKNLFEIEFIDTFDKTTWINKTKFKKSVNE